MNAVSPSRAELVGFLQDPASYPHGPAAVRLVETHISWVAIATPYVYKVKKPVDFGFLDFTTPEKRRQDCEREVALNRRLCPGIYEGVVEIRRAGGRLSFEGSGEPVEYAVKMRELAPEGFLDGLLKRRAAGSETIDRLVRKLAAFYRDQTPTPERSAWGHVEALKVSTDENFDQTAALVGAALPRVSFDALRTFTTAFFEHAHDLLERRSEEGHILDCHGDLRAEHVHVSDAGICIYDCIEFNRRFRYIDVASDVAFLAMDLRDLGHPHLSRYFIRRISHALDDADLPRLIPFYACYRAYVRGKVALMRSEQSDLSDADRTASREEARRYFRLALSYAVGGPGPAVLVVMGRPGAGKSTLAGALGEALGWDVVSSDRVRKAMAGVPLDRRGDSAERARLYSPESTARTYAALREQALDRARAGESTILDATYSRRRHRDALRSRLLHERIFYCFVEVNASERLLRVRLAQRARQDRVVSDARLEDFERLSARYEAPDPAEDERFVSVSTESGLEQTTRTALQNLIARRLSEVSVVEALPPGG